ncbi:MAG: DMT family transporter [Ferruginibacter sp.]|nr:DMT family transporter [Ferruginibacter sp.]
MNSKLINWLIFIALSFIWGSSFILMKEGLVALTAFQVASLRIISSGLVLLPVAYKSFKQIPGNKIFFTFMSGVLGSLLPAYLFCIAEQGIDSSLAGTLNSLTPIFVIIIGAVFFHSKTETHKIIGILVAFSGSVFLFFSQPGFSHNSNIFYVLLVVLATMMYGINVNMVHRYLNHIPSIQIAALALSLNAIPALVVLYFTGYFNLDLSNRAIMISTGYSVILGIFGTAIASIIFYMLIKRAGAVFSSMVTYGIPFVAIIWGIIYGENIGWKQVVGLFIILTGVYLANRKIGDKG